MKTIKSIITFSFLFICLLASSQTKTGVTAENIKVWGNCGMCKGHIEKAAKQAGASYAVWNKNTKILAVKFDITKTTDKQIQEQVAKAGYDTKDFSADAKAYNQLDECCKYDRKSSAKKS